MTLERQNWGNIVTRDTDKKRNLVFVIVESLEASFLNAEDGWFYDEELIPEIKKLALENINFSNTDALGGALQASGSGWTVAALVAHTLGIPLVLPINGNAYDKYESFLPTPKGLTDILSEGGYNQRFLMGSDRKFAGRDVLYKTHGNVTIKDTVYYKASGAIPPDYSVWWGFEDLKLYVFARQELEELAAQDKPFNLMLLTADTHHVGGYVCEACGNQFDEQYKNVLACTSRQLYEFIKWIQAQAWYPDTTIVIVGDHLYMDGTFIPDGKQADRRTLNIYINPAINAIHTKNRTFSAFDTFPSILDAMGVRYDGDGLALGRSLFRDTDTLFERYDKSYLNQELVKRSAVYTRFLYGK